MIYNSAFFANFSGKNDICIDILEILTQILRPSPSAQDEMALERWSNVKNILIRILHASNVSLCSFIVSPTNSLISLKAPAALVIPVSLASSDRGR